MKRAPLLLLAALSLVSVRAFAQVTCYAIAPSSSGSGTGVSWANAHGGIPSTLTRGIRYYFADGSYPGFTFSTAVSGTTIIEFRKAQSNDFGRIPDGCSNDISSGFNAGTMAAGQGVFSRSININAAYFVWNGNGTQTAAGCGGAPASTITGLPPVITDCGFAVDDTSCSSSCSHAVQYSSGPFTVEYVELRGNSTPSADEDNFVQGSGTNPSSWIHIYGHDTAAVYLQYGCNQQLVDHSYWWGTERQGPTSPDDTHGQAMYCGLGENNANSTYSNNVFRDITGTAVVTFGGSASGKTHDNWLFYNNVFMNSTTFTGVSLSLGWLSDGLVACINDEKCTNFQFNQNTIINTGDNSHVELDSSNGAANTLISYKNNLVYGVQFGSTSNDGTGTFTGVNNNSYLNSPCGDTNAAHVCVPSGAPNPFVNWTAYNSAGFNLASDNADWNNRASLAAPFTADFNGNAFTTDRGAYQYVNPTQATQPSCSPGTGTYTSAQTVPCINPNSGTTLMCFTINNTTPVTNTLGTLCSMGTKYTTPIMVSTTETLKIVAGTSTLADSTVASYTYTLTTPTAATPTVSPVAGNYTGGQSVTPSTSSVGAIICWNYTGAPATNGTTGCGPTSTLLTGPIPVSSTATVYAIAGGTGFADSSVRTAPYAISYHAVQLPTTWVNNLEYLGRTSNVILYPPSISSGAWVCGATHFGPYTANSQSSLNQAVQDAETCRTANNSGTTIIIPAGALFSGNPGITLPQTAGDNSTNFIVLTSTTPLTLGQTVCSHGIQDNLPESTQIGLRNHGCNGTAVSYQLGSTITPLSGSFTLANGVSGNTSAYNDVASMYTLECAINSCNALQAGNYDSNNVAPHHFAILNAEIRPIAGITGPNAPFEIGLGSETLLSQIPQHIHLAYSYIHGDWNDAPVSGGVATGGATGANSIPSAIAYRAAVYISTTYNYVDRILRPGSDGQALVLGLAQNIKTVHNWFEGGSEGHICGGESAPIAFTGFLVCQDEEDRANRYTYPYSWMLAADAGLCVNGLACSGNSYERKNAHEYKWGERILNDGDIFENVDNTGAQNGVVISYKTAQTSGGPLGTNYWDVLENYTVTNNVTRNSCSGVSMGYRSDNSGGNGGGVSLPDQIALFQNNLLYNISVSGPGCSGATEQYGWRIANGGPLTTWPATAQRDSSGVTTTLTLTGATGTGVTDMAVGDPVSVSGCSDTTFNTSQTAMGPPALTGTLLNGLIVVYSNPGTASATATGCTLSNSQGWPNYLTALHNTDIADIASPANAPYSSANGGTAVWPLARNLVFQNDIFVNGGINSTAAEGTRTEVRMFDPATLAINNTLMPGRVGTGGATCPGSSGAGCYTEYGGTFAGASPPSTLYLTPTSYCVGSDPTTENCTGILAAMSQSGATPKFPIAINDWNQYRLCHAGDAGCNNKASPYAAGQANQGSDGQDLGFNPVPINAAETSTQYICLTACGTGSFPDVPGAQTVLFRGGILQ